MGREDLLDWSLVGDASGFEEEGLGWELPDFREVVGDVEDGDAAAAEALDDLGFGGGVECGEGFVEQEQLRFWREGASDGDALGFSAGEACGFAVAQGLSVDEGEHFVDAVAALGGWEMAEAEGDVLGDGAVGKERGSLGDEAYVAAAGRNEDAVVGVEQGLVVEDDAALLGSGESGEDSEEGAFAGGGGPEEDGPGRGGVAGDAEVDLEREVAVAVCEGGLEDGFFWEGDLRVRVRHG